MSCFAWCKNNSEVDFDANGDGKVDVNDAIAVATGKGKVKRRRRPAGGASRGTSSSTSSSFLDVDGDGKVDMNDAVAAVKKVRRKKKTGGGGTRGAATGTRASGTTTSSYTPPTVMTSTCTGRKRALLIGINYHGQSGELRGCINDVENVARFIDDWGFTDVRIITDKPGSTDLPNRANIESAMSWLVEGAKSGDSLFLHYSGHGGSTKDESGAEADGAAETIIPLDYKKAGQIVDDDIHERLASHLPEGVRLTAIFDSCHSGSVLDLPYLYAVDGTLEVVEVDIRAIVMSHAKTLVSALASGDKKRAMGEGFAFAKAVYQAKTAGDSEAQNRAEKLRATNADVLQFSGCRDEQTSADATIGGKATGALSWAFIKTFKEAGGAGADLTYTQLLGGIRTNLQKKYSQVPQLTAGRKVNLNTKFTM
jgi:hypothetical protein